MTVEPTPPTEDTSVPPSAKALQALVELLYPDPEVVDILTLDQFIFRYRFSGLGATAVADMERAQRITRSVGDQGQIGLAEFHIGLIYLHWGQFFGAIKYFDDALRHWQFAKQDPAVSLAQLAQGVCQHHAYHYETALTNYGKVQRTLTKIEGNGSVPPPDFLADIKAVLKRCRDDVVLKIRTLGEGEPTMFRVPLPADEASPPGVVNEPPTPETAVDDPTAPSSPPPVGSAVHMASAPPPISNLRPAHTDDAQIGATTGLQTATNAHPIILEKSPIPQHANESEHLVWYQVGERDELEDFLPNIQAETALLVDTRTTLYTCAAEDLVIVNQADTEGSIPVKPQKRKPGTPFTRIYLAEVEAQTATSFTRSAKTDEIELHVKLTAEPAERPIYAEDLLGIVIGIWSKLQPTQKASE